MRYSMLVYLTEMCDTLAEAAGYIRSSPDSGMTSEIINNGKEMLSQLKSVLENFSGDIRSPLLMDELHSIIDLWHEDAGNENMEEKLLFFTKMLPREIEYKVRAVFFAELGEKWDSMESVYAFMRDDPRFDPVVVLTPVFRIVNQNGKQIQDTIYKDYLTPLGIPFYEYNKYSIEEDCPDIAFICQPYESCTLPQFWPENIAKHTRLVYLPYFLVRTGAPTSADTMCRMPVYSHAWRVIGLNEKHKEFYAKYAPNGGKNMLALGLPKLDHIVTLKDRDIPFPKAWKKIEGKKIFLWNTWYSINVSSWKYFDDILEWFRGHDDCALLWRPHPMTETVTKLYYPHLYPKLQECRKIIKNFPNAVIDEEVSYDAAFYHSCALISDWSSLIEQYILTDKPALAIRDEKRAASSANIDLNDVVHFYTWVGEIVTNLTEITEFLQRICGGEDLKAEPRRNMLDTELPVVDGACGARVCETLLNEMFCEDGIEI